MASKRRVAFLVGCRRPRKNAISWLRSDRHAVVENCGDRGSGHPETDDRHLVLAPEHLAYFACLIRASRRAPREQTPKARRSIGQHKPLRLAPCWYVGMTYSKPFSVCGAGLPSCGKLGICIAGWSRPSEVVLSDFASTQGFAQTLTESGITFSGEAPKRSAHEGRFKRCNQRAGVPSEAVQSVNRQRVAQRSRAASASVRWDASRVRRADGA